MNILNTIDAAISPVLIAANRLRQARDRLSPWAWLFVPASIRVPIDALFQAIEDLERRIGQLKDQGLMD